MKAAILIATLAACSGTIDGGEGAGGEGERMFGSTVAPMLRQCAACHEGAGAGPAFLGTPGAEDDYLQVVSSSRIVGNFEPANALLLTKGSHSGVVWWTPGQEATITAWLAAEAKDFGAGNNPDVFAAWAGCMTIENWNDSRMGEWANKQTDQGSTCGGCHSDGEYGFHANPTSDLMFAQQRTALGVGSFFQISSAGVAPEVVPSSAKFRSKCAGANLHPACAVDDEYIEYLERFYRLTRATLAAGLCKSPGYPEPEPVDPGI
ncbi:MAG: hypothetical protein ABI867_07565 [Kofleriaceae bacterium]